MEYLFKPEDFYLPVDSVREELMMTYILRVDEVESDTDELATRLINVALKAGFGCGTDVRGYTYGVKGNVLLIYRKVVCLDIWNHLGVN